MIGEWLVIGMFVSLALLLFTGFPVGLILGGVAVTFGFLGVLLDEFRLIQFFVIVPRIWGGSAENLLMVAVPMFIFMGVMLEKTKVAEDMLGTLQHMLSAVPGGLGLSIVLLGTILAAMTGIIGASVVLLTMLALPTLLERRYHPTLATGVVAASGTLGILIPPSIMLVIMADMLGVSVGSMFLGAIVPGLMLSAIYTIYIVSLGILRPSHAPRPPKSETMSWSELFPRILRSFLPTVALIVLVLGSIFGGFATVTEASGVGALGALLLAALAGRLTWSTMGEVIDRSTRTVAMVFLVIVGATAYAFVFRALGGDGLVRDFLNGLGLGSWGIVIVFMLTVFILGFFFDWIEVVLIVLPIFIPVVQGLDFGDLFQSNREAIVWFGILIAVNLQTSFLTPPFGFALFYLKGTAPAGISIGHIYRGIVPFVMLQIVVVLLLLRFPELVLWLPRAALG